MEDLVGAMKLPPTHKSQRAKAREFRCSICNLKKPVRTVAGQVVCSDCESDYDIG